MNKHHALPRHWSVPNSHNEKFSGSSHFNLPYVDETHTNSFGYNLGGVPSKKKKKECIHDFKCEWYQQAKFEEDKEHLKESLLDLVSSCPSFNLQ